MRIANVGGRVKLLVAAEAVDVERLATATSAPIRRTPTSTSPVCPTWIRGEYAF